MNNSTVTPPGTEALVELEEEFYCNHALHPVDPVPTTWGDAVRIEPHLESLRYLAGLRPGGETWGESGYFFAELRKLVGPSARNPLLRGAFIASVATNIITQCLEL